MLDLGFVVGYDRVDLSVRVDVFEGREVSRVETFGKYKFLIEYIFKYLI